MVRLGVIGFGRRMRHMVATMRRFQPDLRVVALLDPRAAELCRDHSEALAGTVVCTSIDELLAHEIDGVAIGTRCSSHAPYAAAVLAAGRPLFLEKPVATSWEQVVDLERAVAASRGPVVVSFPLRVSALCETVRALIESGAIGSVEQVQAVNNVPFYSTGYYHGWMRDDAETGGLWLQKATHDFDYIQALVNKPVAAVTAVESKTVYRGDRPAGLRCVDCGEQQTCAESPLNLFYQQGLKPSVEPNDWQCAFAVDTGNHDSATAILQYTDGSHAVYTQNFYTRRGAAARGATLIGYRGTISFDWYRNEVVVHHHQSARVERHRFEHGGEGHHGGDVELAHDFLACVAGTGQSRTPLQAGLASVRLCLAAREACRRGLAITPAGAARLADGQALPA